MRSWGRNMRWSLALVVVGWAGCFTDTGALVTPRPEVDADVPDADEPRCISDGDCDDGQMCVEQGGTRLCVCSPSVELCDGVDNDCNTATPDGAAEATLGDACDGEDGDMCARGEVRCVDAEMICVGDEASAGELCDGVDNDCNPETLDGAAEPGLGGACDGDDADSCESGTIACVGGSLVCADEGENQVETCDGLDNDCDGELNEDGVCDGCVTSVRGTRVYLYCDDTMDWRGARARCVGWGGDLLIVDNELEWEWVKQRHRDLTSDARHESWIGLSRDPLMDSGWLRVDGAASVFEDWWSDGWSRQPDNFLSREDCVEMFYREEFDGRWNDQQCSASRRYWCEFSGG